MLYLIRWVKEVSLAKRIAALLLGLLIGGTGGLALGYAGLVVVVLSGFTIFNSGGGCLGHTPDWYEAAFPCLAFLSVSCGLGAGLKIGIKVRKKVLENDFL
jgi:hypothetical protein